MERDMSGHGRSNRRGGGSGSGLRGSGNERQEWVPRGSTNVLLASLSAPSEVAFADDLGLNSQSEREHGKNPCGSVGVSASSPVLGDLGFDGIMSLSKGGRGKRSHRKSGVSSTSSGNDRGSGFRGREGREADHRKEKEKIRGDKGERDPNLPQLVQEIQEKLQKGAVECMICYDMVRRSAPIWSCSSCYSIFHLNCIKKWVRAPTSVDLSANKNHVDNWRCPGCQHVQLTSSKEINYTCFCGKRTEPPSDLYLTPHSCGEPCGKPLERNALHSDEGIEDFCPHACVLPCHPGPCPPCKAFAPPRLCSCGKTMLTARCSDQRSSRTCGQICDKRRECGRHHCQQVCHVGPCDSCQAVFNASCFCRRKLEVVMCGEIAMKGILDLDNGVFACGSSCGKLLSCGNHLCEDACHPGSCGECDLVPGKINTCYCGKTSGLEKRKSCLDPIPTCSHICGNVLPCGLHVCEETCHSGSCPPCLVSVSQQCRCSLSSRSVECYRTREEVFCCDKQCGRKKNCGRHRCNERCCPLLNTNFGSPDDCDPHLCSMSCGKKLRCGQHSCGSFCHSGHCPPCLENIFTDLTCACGRTVIPPPLPCGTPPPSCQHPCSIPQPCGHQYSHSCHLGECPPCSVPVAKECIGGHVVLRNIPCGSKDIRCNKICGKSRRCGLHACCRTCHPPPCDSDISSRPDSRVSCGQICGAPRRDCKHTCKAPCHPSSPCPDVRCDFSVTVSCSCGRITGSVPCDAGGTNVSYVTDSLQAADAYRESSPLGQRNLACDEECSKLERKKVLADAFDANPPSLEALHFGESASISDSIVDLFRRDPKWVGCLEERCKYLVLGKGRGGMGSLKVHVFSPMPKQKRDAVRLIAERWKLTVNAAGWEPKRFIVIHATSNSKVPPLVLGAKGSVTSNALHPPSFDPLLDMDPRLVVCLFNLHKETDVSALVLRFGGECELVWLNDKNALAVFHHPARAATALRRLDHVSVYFGAAVINQNGETASSASGGNPWGSTKLHDSLKSNPWKRAVVQEPSWKGDSGGMEYWPDGSQTAISKAREAPVSSSGNRWSILNSETAVVSAESSTSSGRTDDVNKKVGVVIDRESSFESDRKKSITVLNGVASSDVADYWEDACE